MSLDKKNHADVLYPGIKRDQAFSVEPRWKAHDAPLKNFRIGSSGPDPCVGQYHFDSSSFNK
jgi:hypothetical protein